MVGRDLRGAWDRVSADTVAHRDDGRLSAAARCGDDGVSFPARREGQTLAAGAVEPRGAWNGTRVRHDGLYRPRWAG